MGRLERQGFIERMSLCRARMWLRPGGRVATPGLTAQLEVGSYVSATTPFGDAVVPMSFSGSVCPTSTG
jgi:hypothetical protein